MFCGTVATCGASVGEAAASAAFRSGTVRLGSSAAATGAEVIFGGSSSGAGVGARSASVVVGGGGGVGGGVGVAGSVGHSHSHSHLGSAEPGPGGLLLHGHFGGVSCP